MPLDEALKIMLDSGDEPALRKLVLEVQRSIRSGASFPHGARSTGCLLALST
jgi:type II secretory pathway component PulF